MTLELGPVTGIEQQRKLAAEIERDHFTRIDRALMARHPIPLMILARLAASRPWAGKGLGSGLLKDAMLRTLEAAEIAGLRAFAVHAKDDEAQAFYKRFDFIASPSDPMHLFVLLKDVRRMIG